MLSFSVLLSHGSDRGHSDFEKRRSGVGIVSSWIVLFYCRMVVALRHTKDQSVRCT